MLIVNDIMTAFIFLLSDPFRKMTGFQFKPVFATGSGGKNSCIDPFDIVFNGFPCPVSGDTEAGAYFPDATELPLFDSVPDPFVNPVAGFEAGFR